MIRLCMFGTSHIAAPWNAYRAEPDAWPELDITFVGATGHRLLDHRIAKGVMIPTTADLEHNMQHMAGTGALDLGRFDAFAVIGGDVGQHMIGYVYGQVRWIGLPSMAGHDFAEPARWALMSEAAVDAVLTHRIQHSVAGRICDTLRKFSDKPIFVAEAPRPSEALMSSNEHKLLAIKRAVRRGDAAYMADKYETLVKACFEQQNIDFLGQPAFTIKNHMLTRAGYMEDAVRLSMENDISQPDADLMHGNRPYGVALMDKINATLTTGAS